METRIARIQNLAYQIKIHREYLKKSQSQLAKSINASITRSNIAHLEQGIRIPEKEKLKLICEAVNLPKELWEDFLNEKSIFRLNFEIQLSEFIGNNVNSNELDSHIINELEDNLYKLFNKNLTPEQSLDYFNSIVVYYGVSPINKPFFDEYLTKDAFRSLDAFKQTIIKFQTDAIRLYSTIQEAFEKINTNSKESFNIIIEQLKEKNTDNYTNRTDWDRINIINNSDLPFLGYIAASKVKQEESERKALASFLDEIIKQKEKGEFDINSFSKKRRRKMDSLLRKFNSSIEHGLFSPLFNPEISILKRESEYISPSDSTDISKMEDVQTQAYNNLSNYLTADYMDVYVATSMRNSADFISVNNFVEDLFQNSEIRQYKLRYFNPTQSWIEDRVAKGLVEALMLKRADICIYMAQKEDTFGKDSEASVTLGQGKPVIIYVPKLHFSKFEIDSEKFGKMKRSELVRLIKDESEEESIEIDDLEDNEALHSRLLDIKLDNLESEDYIEIVKKHWADFDLENEFNKRIGDEEKLASMKEWFQNTLGGEMQELTKEQKETLKNILVGVTIRFEKRAKIFREIHPLALQVILSTGVLNGILVVRSVQSCANLVRDLIRNKLSLKLEVDEKNYRLIETNTLSTIRVISRHKLISNAFKTFYKINE